MLLKVTIDAAQCQEDHEQESVEDLALGKRVVLYVEVSSAIYERGILRYFLKECPLEYRDQLPVKAEVQMLGTGERLSATWSHRDYTTNLPVRVEIGALYPVPKYPELVPE